MTKIMVVDDHTIIRQGIAGLLRSVEDFEVIAEAGTGAAAVRHASDLKPDLIIMDMSLPDMDGIETARRIKAEGIKSEIIFLTMHNDPGLHEMARQIGVRGYLLKDDAMDDLVYAIRAVLSGESFTSGSLKADTSATMQERDGETPAAHSSLTRREEEIVSLIASGMSSKEIADKLFISVRTVETHRGHIMEKLGVRSMAELIRYALNSGLAK